MMQPPNRLAEGRPLGRTKGEIELWFLLPSQERLGGDIDCARGFLGRAGRQQGGDRILLLAPEFCAVSAHLRTSEDIWAKSPVLRRGRFPSQFTCFTRPP